MLIRCDVGGAAGTTDLRVCMKWAAHFAAKGYRISWAVNKDGIEAARALLGDAADLHRIPPDQDGDLERMTLLHRKGRHQSAFVNLRALDSAYLFNLRRLFRATVVYDHGSRILVYATAIVNPDIVAMGHRYKCNPEAKLLLGPKFFIPGRQLAQAPDPARPVDHALLAMPSGAQGLASLLRGFALLPDPPALDLLCPDTEAVETMVAALRPPDRPLQVRTLKPNLVEPIPYERYAFIVTEPNRDCLALAQMGLFFVTVAMNKSDLERAYALEQLGVSPTLGWHQTKTAEACRDFLQPFLARPELRTKHAAVGPKLIDGQALKRLEHFVPFEVAAPIDAPGAPTDDL